MPDKALKVALHKIGRTQKRLLRHVAVAERVRSRVLWEPAELGARWGVTTSMVTQAGRALHRRRLVGVDSYVRRWHAVWLTPLGRRAVEALWADGVDV